MTLGEAAVRERGNGLRRAAIGTRDGHAKGGRLCNHQSMNDKIFVGIKGTVVALDRASGTELWRAKLSGSDFVNVVLDGADLLAATRGEIYCLDTTTGATRWHNQLGGLGYGFVAIAGASQQVVAAAEKQKRDAAAAAAAASAGA